jgi:signal transduction histidine kinase
MILSKLNGIAARIASAIVLAIILGILMTIALSEGVNHYRFRPGSGLHGKSHLLISAGGVSSVNPYMHPVMLSGKIAMIIRAAASSPQPENRKFIAAMASPEMEIAFDAPALAGSVERLDGNLDRLEKLVQMQLEESSPPISVRARRVPARSNQAADQSQSRAPDDQAVIEADLPDGHSIALAIPGYPVANGLGLVLLLISIVVVSGFVSILTARRLARPIREFARGAERLGVDLTAPPLPVSGPQELRTTIEAFNRMQDRLRRFLEDRTQMLAAISHDLRAPLARLRLRAELVAKGEQQHKMFDDLEAMNAMIDSTLAFARDEARQEPRRLVDLCVLVGDVCEDVEDAGGKVSYVGPRCVDVSCRPTLIRRAVANLIDNAIKYGHAAQVQIVRDIDRVVIVVDDEGPGIPAEEREKVFAPFYRLEAARDPGKAGVGLGLSVARTVAREHGGDVTLKNRDNGGLSALIELPA